MATVLERLEQLEERAWRHEARLAQLETPHPAPSAGPWAAPAQDPRTSFGPPQPPPGFGPPRPAPGPPSFPLLTEAAPARPRLGRIPQVELEDLLGGRVLAWAGGLTVALGLIFLVALGVSEGWIDETARVLLAGTGALALLGTGICLREQGTASDAALAATGAGICSLFAVIAMAGPGYDLVPAFGALVLALATGATATALAVRWDTRGMAALGIGGALLSFAVAGAPQDSTTVALLWIVAVAGAAVLVHREWSELAGAIVVISLPQWAAWTIDDASDAGALAALLGFGAVNVAAALGFELRRPATKLRPDAALLLAGNAGALAIVGAFALPETTLHLWLLALAAAHAVAALSPDADRLPRDARVLCLGVATVFADIVLALVLKDEGLAIAWGAAAVLAAIGARHVLGRGPLSVHEQALLAVGLGAQLALAAIQALLLATPVDAVDGVTIATGGLVATSAVAVAAFAAARALQSVRPDWRMVLDGAALLAVGYLTVLVLEGPALTVAFAVEGVALATVAALRRDDVAVGGAAAFLGAALLHALLLEAPPGALVTGPPEPVAAALALGAGAAGCVASSWLLHDRLPRWTAASAGTALLAVLYLASVELVGALVTGSRVSTGEALDVGPDQLSQAALSVLWAVAGLGALLAGLSRDMRWLRLGGLALLLTTMGKVFLLDLAWLDESYRAISFVALGVLLLSGAYAWQRARPRPSRETHEVP